MDAAGTSATPGRRRWSPSPTSTPNVYLDTSACTARRYPAELVDYLRGRGKTKVLFGTNYPMITPVRALEHVADVELDEQTAALSSCRATARHVFVL